MKRLTILWCVIFSIALFSSAFAFDTEYEKAAAERTANLNLTSNLAPTKAPYSGPENKPDPQVIAQGGDTKAEATVIAALPYANTGSTVGFVDDYEAVCPYTGTAPDVVYSYTPAVDEDVDVTLCTNSSYDTKLYIHDAAGTEIACNDDACSTPSYGGPYVSDLSCVPLVGGTLYYFIVDGYGAGAGDYTIDVDICVVEPPCVVDCPPGATIEGEPDCGFGYVDMFNGGCNATPPVFGTIACGETICGTSGVFEMVPGTLYRDTDWYEVIMADAGELTFSGVAEFGILLFIIDSGSGDCLDYVILGSVTAAACDTASLTANVAAGTYWVFVGPSAWDPIWACPTGYTVWLDCALPPPCTDVLIGDLVLPYADLGATNCGFGNDQINTCLGSYDGGEDIVYEFNVTSEVTVDIIMDPLGATWTGLLIDSSCPPDPTTCLGMDTGSSGVRSILGITLPIGTYFIMIDTWPTPDCIPAFDLTITEIAAQFCEIDMVSDIDPVEVPAGGSFGFTGFLTNPDPVNPIVSDVWVQVKFGGFSYMVKNLPARALAAGETLTATFTQSVPAGALPGAYEYIAYCGDPYEWAVCDSVSFPFTVTAAIVPGGADAWKLEGDFGSGNTIADLPTEFKLRGSYPNPFNATTTIGFDVPVASNVSLDIYNLIGQKVATLVNGQMEAGSHSVTWDAANFSSGLYFYKLTAGETTFKKRMTLLK